MTKQFWVNLPVKDVARSREFFSKLGFSFNQQYGNSEENCALSIGDNKVIVMLFTEPLFKGFARHEIADVNQGSEVLFSIDAESREEVDEMAARAREAGGVVFGEPGEKDGWMYGCGFSDLDGHRWSVLYMDFSKLPQQ
jgi:predicted lactoylglutathione lyase